MLLIAVAALAEGLDSVLNWLGIGLFALAAAAYRWPYHTRRALHALRLG